MTPDRSVDDSPEFESVAAALDDGDCRQIVSVLEEPMTVDEIATRAELPLSSTYRKLDQLTNAGLVDEAADGRRGRNRKSRYVVTFERIGIELDDDREFRVSVERAKDHLLALWSEVRREV
ncbi:MULTISPECIES: helix-turn-helix domain-containing protein [Natrialba]|uniref:Helix-turn-helix transcriptional regulator n=1 Tax=Natrialba swarupiae TaxID=2448032 RepID=A0A5D5AHH0_9EURY|nr:MULTISPECIES: helix-turn-helix domain-containing protein [Natrialba]MWV41067.1 helix-turn-helix domain-containing protein [Natrialba sp. INN-245]TYT60465.1 helix-turn-helix transcriptional regulator [Natrialba swarupiae]